MCESNRGLPARGLFEVRRLGCVAEGCAAYNGNMTRGVVLGIWVVLGIARVTSAADAIQIATAARSVQPGEVVLLTASALTPIDAPNVKGLDMKAVYALKAGSNQSAGKVEAWDVPMLVAGGSTYDIALEQSAGLTRIRSGVTPARGELLEIR
jgi:hypothetical protein